MTLKLANIEATDAERKYATSTMLNNGFFHSPEHFIDDPELATAQSLARRLCKDEFMEVDEDKDRYGETPLTQELLDQEELSALSVLAIGAISLTNTYPQANNKGRFLLSIRRYDPGDGMDWHTDDADVLLQINMIHLLGVRATTFKGLSSASDDSIVTARTGDLLKVPTLYNIPEAISMHRVDGPSQNEPPSFSLLIIQLTEDTAPDNLTHSFDDLVEHALHPINS